MNDISPKEAKEILSHYTDLGYGVVIEGDDTSKIKQALSLARKTLASGGDCISREALKEEVRKHTEYYADRTSEDRYNVGYTECACEILDFIDNAPTVEVFTLEDMQNNFDAGVDSVIGKYDRPKGEWVAIEPYTHKTFCPFCKEDTRFEVGKYDNFCPNCGADLRGGDNE